MSDEVIKLAEEFAEEITKCKEYKEFMEADRALKNSQDSIDLINKFNRKQEELRHNYASESEKNEFKELQNQLQNDKTVQDLIRAQDTLVKLLRETNRIISEDIDSPFAFFKGGGCCG